MNQNPSNDELRLAELLAQFLDLSDDNENAGRILFLAPDGSYVGDATLSARDIEAATDALISLNQQRADLEEATRPADPLPELDEGDAEEFIGQIDAFLANGGQI